MSTVLLLVDFQNDFLSSPGLQPARGELQDRARSLLRSCRSRGIPVIHIRMSVAADDPRRFEHWKREARRCCVPGSAGHSHPEGLQPVQEEAIVDKRGYSGFGSGALDSLLSARKPDVLWIAGVHLHACVRATALDAYERGYQVRIVEDAVGSDEPLHAAVVRDYLERRTIAFAPAETLLAEGRPRNPVRLPSRDVEALPAAVIAGERRDGTPHSWEHESPRELGRILFRGGNPGPETVHAAVVAAREAGTRWRPVPLTERVEQVLEFRRRLEARKDEFVRRIVEDVGKPVLDARAEVDFSLKLLDDLAGDLTHEPERAVTARTVMRRVPHGVVALISPWNNPLLIPLGKMIPAVLLGNTVVWKTAPAAAAISVAVMELLAGSFPPGVINLIAGGRGAAISLMKDDQVDAVTITGSLSAGFTAQSICASRHIPIQAELGGNNAAIVWEDCDLSVAAASVADGAFRMAGQRCTANRRVIVPSTMMDAFLRHLGHAMESLTWGDPTDPHTVVGPLISVSARERVRDLVDRALRTGATPLPSPMTAHCEMMERGAYYPPTALVCRDPSQEIVQEESFGPVMVVQPADSFAEALELLNGVRQGLAASLFSASGDRRAQFLATARVGTLKLDQNTAGVAPRTPFGGWKASGVGPPEHGPADREFFTRIQSVYH
jgi:acyl-CoA reductase-like NAD-dependent aldehyde dehydrogenase/nicotinamidase-related amidase